MDVANAKQHVSKHFLKFEFTYFFLKMPIRVFTSTKTAPMTPVRAPSTMAEGRLEMGDLS